MPGSRTCFEAIPIGVFVMQLEDPARADSLRIVFANASHRGLLGLDRSLTVGRLIGEAFPNSLDPTGARPRPTAGSRRAEKPNLGLVSYGDRAGRRPPLRRHGPSTRPRHRRGAVRQPERRPRPGEPSSSPSSTRRTTRSWAGTSTARSSAGTPRPESLYGYSAEEAIGQPIAMLLRPTGPTSRGHPIRRLNDGERIDHFETARIRKDGTLARGVADDLAAPRPAAATWSARPRSRAISASASAPTRGCGSWSRSSRRPRTRSSAARPKASCAAATPRRSGCSATPPRS